jgi:carboxylesterase type B
MGYSAGASAVEYLVSSPELQDHRLFNQVFLDSGIPYMSAERDRNVTDQFVEMAKVSAY